MDRDAQEALMLGVDNELCVHFGIDDLVPSEREETD